jgi:hypothetical protein
MCNIVDPHCRRCEDNITRDERTHFTVLVCDVCNFVFHRECMIPAFDASIDISSRTGVFACCEECATEVTDEINK